jgi:lipoprotein-anchoring transpeptidase ErfK/SrfK
LAAVVLVVAFGAGPAWSALHGHLRVLPGQTVTQYFPLTTGAGEGETASVVAEARGPTVAVFATPAAGQPSMTFDNPTADHQPRVFLVVGRNDGWLQVLLPVRPNETAGWVRLDDVVLKSNRFRIEVDLSGHRVTVWDGARILLRVPAAVGRAVTETPKGVYFLTSLLQPPEPGGLYGPYAFGTSAYSDVLTEFAGGDGVIGIHGTDDPSAIGHDVSHGCIRLDNEAISRLAGVLPLGTPVFIDP